MMNHPAFIGISIALTICFVGAFTDVSIQRVIGMDGGLYAILRDLGGFLGALIALFAAGLTYYGGVQTSRNADKDRALSKLKGFQSVLTQINYAYQEAVGSIDREVGSEIIDDKIEIMDRLRRSPEFLEMMYSDLMEGEGQAANFFSNTLVMAVAKNARNRERERELAEMMLVELRASVSRRIASLNSGSDLKDIRSKNVITMEKYYKLMTNGTPIDPDDVVWS